MNNVNDRDHFHQRHHNQFLHPDDAYYRQELPSTSANATDTNSFDLKGGFRMRFSNVRQLLLIFLVWFLSVTILSLLIWLIVLPQFPLSLVIETSSGRLLGTLETRLGKQIIIYHGIPYAKPPTGQRRFTRPEPGLPWKGIYRATTKPPSCYQFASDSPKNMFQSEDCLYLNLYVPLNEEDEEKDKELKSAKLNESQLNEFNQGSNEKVNKPTNGKPVLVFIHSGGFMVGSINQFDPSILAIEGNIIVVTISYRLGLFGFIYYELTGKPAQQHGNLGLYDQLLALQWIHANIQQFKGDPDNIVLFGDYAGAQSVGFHLISNHSRPYFKRAILLNGSPFNLALVMSRERSLNRTRALINATDCWSIDENQSQNSTDLSITSRSIDCLKKLKAPQLMQIDRSLYQKSTSSAMYLTYYPVAEESFFYSHPFELIESGDYGPQTEIMVGVNGHYATWMQDLGLTDFILNGMKLGSTEITPKMISRLAKFGPNIGQHYYEMLTQVIMEDHTAVSPIGLAERINSLTLDMAFRCPNYFMINSFIQNETRSVYYFELRASTGYELVNKVIASLTNNSTSSKSTDIGMIFGYPLNPRQATQDGKDDYDEEDVTLSKTIMNYWIEFIKNGKPTLNDSWIPCKNEQGYYRYVIKKKGSILKSGFTENQCDQYFRILYDIGKSIGKH